MARSPSRILRRVTLYWVLAFTFLVILASLVVTLLIANESKSSSAQQDSILTALLFVGGVTSSLLVGFLMLRYLQLNQKDSGSDRANLFRSSTMYGEISALRALVEGLKGEKELSISAEDRSNILTNVEKAVSEDIVSKISEQWDKTLRERALNDRHLDFIGAVAEEMQDRLRREVAALERRANLNLVIGFLISALGLAVLGWFVFQTAAEIHGGVDLPETGMRFFVRLSVAVFIQIFAYFFLRLYRTALFDIKYFQNEITATQFRLMALEAALKIGDKKILEKLCVEMAKTERNTILRKGETTTALRKEEIEAIHDKRTVDLLQQLLLKTNIAGGAQGKGS